MAHNKHGQSDYDPIPDTGKLYETRDVSISALVKWVVFLFVFVAGCSVAAFILYKVFVPGGEEASQFPMARVRQLPPGPRFRPTRYRTSRTIGKWKAPRSIPMDATHAQEPFTFPVERAIDLTLQDLPTRPGAGTIDYSKSTAPNTPPQMDGQAAGGNGTGQPAATGANNAPQGAGQPGMNPMQSTMPTPNAPGTGKPAIPGGNNATGRRAARCSPLTPAEASRRYIVR